MMLTYHSSIPGTIAISSFSATIDDTRDSKRCSSIWKCSTDTFARGRTGGPERAGAPAVALLIDMLQSLCWRFKAHVRAQGDQAQSQLLNHDRRSPFAERR